ncbi:general L-amino acid transport system permease protein [Mesorhizobium soli]|uniref:amino acid ABC transporter permease n=1 Tax=Pseudaminobacter soli (ex Li et al. 2025) TaxID=1295366 RepID=UPI0024769934|nr:ABC transporter permease subunit [Mesorhizobium soli]MDH6233048.1 general L-amino acid transport system permease protein [Mesorhizobium soli]
MSPIVLLRDQRARELAYQVVCVAAVVGCGWYLLSNALANLAHQDIATGFDYLGREAGFIISETPIAYEPSDSYGRALLVGLLNTIKVAGLSIVFGTIIGTLVGIARLSNNPLLSRLMLLYVEALRNVPLLLYLFLWYSVIIFTLPPVKQAIGLLPGVYVSNSGLAVPAVVWHSGFWAITLAAVLGAAAAFGWQALARRRRIATGNAKAGWPVAVALFVLPVVVAVLLFEISVDLDWPVLGKFRLTAGAHLKPEFVALLLGLTLGTSATVAEIVRGGILAIGRGQREAARALGLPDSLSMRLVILPQALRIIVPPLTNVYVTTFKNSSLAIAIGYPDVVMVSNTIMNQTGQAIEPIALFMLAYLFLSLATSLLMNWYNGRVALKGR